MLLRRIVFGELCGDACKGTRYFMFQIIELDLYQEVSLPTQLGSKRGCCCFL